MVLDRTSVPDIAPLRYRLAVSRPESHLCEVELRFRRDGGPPVRIEMAAWCPGSYLIRDYARYVRDLEARGADGEALPVTQVSKREWEIGGEAAEVIVSYRVYGHDLTVRSNHIDATHAFLHLPALCLFPSGSRDAACEVVVEPPPGREWPVVTALPLHGDRHRAADVDELFDCPIHIGPVERRQVEAGGRPVSIAVWGRPAQTAPFGLDELAADVARVIDVHAARLGPLPCERYTFIVMLSPGAYGGLEHRSSSANLCSPHSFATPRGYYQLIELLSHEVFHAWNGIRMRPRAFARFDYGCENYTRCLWVVEGITSYYDRLSATRAGVIPVAQYLTKLAEEWGRMLSIPGRQRHSLEEASLNAWVKLYRPDESNLNTTVSYYLKGGLVMCALDLELRRRSGGEMTFDRVLAAMWREHGDPARGYPEDLRPTFEAAAGMDLGPFFERCITGREDPDLPELLGTVGLKLVPGWDGHKPDEGGEPPVWLGLVLQGSGRVVAGVLDGGPADRAGLSPGDELLAVDGFQITGDADLRQRLAGRRAGDRIEIAMFHRGRLERVEVEVAAAPPTRFEVVASATASASERRIFAEWLGGEYPAAGPVAAASLAVNV